MKGEEEKEDLVNSGTKHSGGVAAELESQPTGQLTPEQITNWRKAMVGMLGGYALIMPDEDVQRLRDKMQGWCDSSQPTASSEASASLERLS